MMRKLKLIPFILFLALISSVAAQTPIATTTNNLPIIENSNIIIKSTKFDPAPAEPGQYLDAFIVVQNLGNRDFEQTYLKLEEEYPFSFPRGEESTQLVELIPPGREELLEYRLFVDDQAVEGTYDLNLVLCSDKDCNYELRETTFSITVKTGGSPKLEIGLEDSATFLPGTLGEITVSAVNKGKLGIKFLTIEIMESEQYELVSPARVYIGELDSDDFETEDFQIFINEGTESKVTVPVKVEYSDSNFREYAGVENVELRVFSEEEAAQIGLISDGNPTIYYVIGAVVLVLLFFFYRRRKKRKNAP